MIKRRKGHSYCFYLFICLDFFRKSLPWALKWLRHETTTINPFHQNSSKHVAIFWHRKSKQVLIDYCWFICSPSDRLQRSFISRWSPSHQEHFTFFRRWWMEQLGDFLGIKKNSVLHVMLLLRFLGWFI